MDVYFAGYLGQEHSHVKLLEQTTHRLLSYHYMSKGLNRRYFEEHRDSYEKIIVDSGAFSVWNKGDVIDIDEYIDYGLLYNDKISYVVNLDVIPGSPGRRPSKDEVERSAAAGYQNYRYMLRKGIPKEKLLHVFHQGESFRWLERMVRELDYIGLSPANDRSTKEKMQWLKECMPFVTGSDGKPTIKFHGFAVTSIRLMRMFPFYSVDSASWGRKAGYRDVDVPWRFVYPHPDKWYFSPLKTRINFGTMREDSWSFHRLSDAIQEDIAEYLADHGVTFDCLSSMVHRQLLNACYINTVAKGLKADHRYPAVSDAERRKLRFRYNLRSHLVYHSVVSDDDRPDTWPPDWGRAQERARRVVAVPPVLP